MGMERGAIGILSGAFLSTALYKSKWTVLLFQFFNSLSWGMAEAHLQEDVSFPLGQVSGDKPAVGGWTHRHRSTPSAVVTYRTDDAGNLTQSVLSTLPVVNHCGMKPLWHLKKSTSGPSMTRAWGSPATVCVSFPLNLLESFLWFHHV